MSGVKINSSTDLNLNHNHVKSARKGKTKPSVYFKMKTHNATPM
jgi:hypothetical protein